MRILLLSGILVGILPHPAGYDQQVDSRPIGTPATSESAMIENTERGAGPYSQTEPQASVLARYSVAIPALPGGIVGGLVGAACLTSNLCTSPVNLLSTLSFFTAMARAFLLPTMTSAPWRRSLPRKAGSSEASSSAGSGEARPPPRTALRTGEAKPLLEVQDGDAALVKVQVLHLKG